MMSRPFAAISLKVRGWVRLSAQMEHIPIAYVHVPVFMHPSASVYDGAAYGGAAREVCADDDRSSANESSGARSASASSGFQPDDFAETLFHIYERGQNTWFPSLRPAPSVLQRALLLLFRLETER